MISTSFERPERTARRAGEDRNRYKIRNMRPYDRLASSQVNVHNRVSGTHRLPRSRTSAREPASCSSWAGECGGDGAEHDPVRYSAALSESGLAVLRRAVNDRSAHPDPDFAVLHTQERLAVLDGDIDRIFALPGGDLTSPHQFIRVAGAMRELDRSATRATVIGAQPSCQGTAGVAKVADSRSPCS